MSDSVYVTAVFRAKPDRLADVIAVFKELAPPSRDEPGCVEYGFYQDTQDAAVLIANEIWQDDAAFAAHLETPHFKTAIAGLDGLLSTEPAIHQCQPLI